MRSKYCNLIQIIYDNSFETNELFGEVLTYIKEVFSLEEINAQVQLDATECALELLIANFSYFEADFMKEIKTLLAKFEKFLSTNIISLKTKSVRALAEIISYSDDPDIFEPLIYKILETTLQTFDSANENEVKIK